MSEDAKIISFRAFENPPLKGFFDIELFDCIIIKSAKLMENNDEDLWVALPSIKQGDDWQNTIYINDEDLKDEILDLAIEEYNNAPKSTTSSRSRRRSGSSRSRGNSNKSRRTQRAGRRR